MDQPRPTPALVCRLGDCGPEAARSALAASSGRVRAALEATATS